MDKIIDGVDVSGCDSYTHNHNELMPYGDVKVTEHYCWHINSNCDGKDCDFKQLKRLQAENEELKNQYSFSTILKIDKLEQENERLKEEKGGMQILINGYIELTEKYKQALQEIRDIVNKAYYTEDYMLGQRFTELVDTINLTITNIIGAE